MNLLLIIELYGVDILEHLPEVRLDGSGFFSLRKDLQKIIVTEEIESSELLSLLLEVVV